MAAEIYNEFGIEAELVVNDEGGGIFDVIFFGKLIYSKRTTGRLPNPMEVIGIIRKFM